jgi:hypothetical protein
MTTIVILYCVFVINRGIVDGRISSRLVFCLSFCLPASVLSAICWGARRACASRWKNHIGYPRTDSHIEIGIGAVRHGWCRREDCWGHVRRCVLFRALHIIRMRMPPMRANACVAHALRIAYLANIMRVSQWRQQGSCAPVRTVRAGRNDKLTSRVSGSLVRAVLRFSNGDSKIICAMAYHPSMVQARRMENAGGGPRLSLARTSASRRLAVGIRRQGGRRCLMRRT